MVLLLLARETRNWFSRELASLSSSENNEWKCSCTCIQKQSRSTKVALKANSLVDSVVDQQLCENGGEEGGGDTQTKAASGSIKRPPQAQGQGCER